MAAYQIWHNPRCSKSRAALARLQEAGVEPEVVKYLEAPPSKGRLKEVLGLLGLEDPRQLMRTKEAEYRELGLAEERSREALLEAMAAHPRLIERPVVIKDDREAVLGRPAEAVDRLL